MGDLGTGRDVAQAIQRQHVPAHGRERPELDLRLAVGRQRQQSPVSGQDLLLEEPLLPVEAPQEDTLPFPVGAGRTRLDYPEPFVARPPL